MNDAQRCGTERKLRKQLRPVEHTAQGGKLKALFRNYDGIAGVDGQTVELIHSPLCMRTLPTHNFAVRTDDEIVMIVRILVGPSGELEIGSSAA